MAVQLTIILVVMHIPNNTNCRHVCVEAENKGCHNSVPEVGLSQPTRVWSAMWGMYITKPKHRQSKLSMVQLTVYKCVLHMLPVMLWGRINIINVGSKENSHSYLKRHWVSVCVSFSLTVWTMWRLCTTTTAPTCMPVELGPSTLPVRLWRWDTGWRWEIN